MKADVRDDSTQPRESRPIVLERRYRIIIDVESRLDRFAASHLFDAWATLEECTPRPRCRSVQAYVEYMGALWDTLMRCDRELDQLLLNESVGAIQRGAVDTYLDHPDIWNDETLIPLIDRMPLEEDRRFFRDVVGHERFMDAADPIIHSDQTLTDIRIATLPDRVTNGLGRRVRLMHDLATSLYAVDPPQAAKIWQQCLEYGMKRPEAGSAELHLSAVRRLQNVLLDCPELLDLTLEWDAILYFGDRYDGTQWSAADIKDVLPPVVACLPSEPRRFFEDALSLDLFYDAVLPLIDSVRTKVVDVWIAELSLRGNGTGARPRP